MTRLPERVEMSRFPEMPVRAAASLGPPTDRTTARAPWLTRLRLRLTSGWRVSSTAGGHRPRILLQIFRAHY